jgi:hypothetical protein
VEVATMTTKIYALDRSEPVPEPLMDSLVHCAVGVLLGQRPDSELPGMSLIPHFGIGDMARLEIERRARLDVDAR